MTVTTRSSKGTALTYTEMDANLTHLNTLVTRPCFYATMVGQTFQPNDSNTSKTPLNTTLVNEGNCWDTSNYIFTAPVAGVYNFNWGFSFGPSSAEGRYMASRIYKNDVHVGNIHRNRPTTAQGGNQYSGIDMSIMLSFAKDETFWVILQASAIFDIGNEYGTYMSGFLLRES